MSQSAKGSAVTTRTVTATPDSAAHVAEPTSLQELLNKDIQLVTLFFQASSFSFPLMNGVYA